MRSIKIIHAADFHLDSPYQALSAAKAAVRREEQRELLAALAALAADESADLMLLSGDLLDSGNTYYETGEELIRGLAGVPCPVPLLPTGTHPRCCAASTPSAGRGFTTCCACTARSAIRTRSAIPSPPRTLLPAALTMPHWAACTVPRACSAAGTPGTHGRAARRATALMSAARRP